jgi:arylsulfatase A-like enzyme
MITARLSTLSAAVWLIASGAALAAAPNFVVILGEAQGFASASVPLDDTLPQGRDTLARTPNLERLAAEGMRFARFYAASPRCTPTRAALFTGRSPAALHMTFVGEGRGGRESAFSETGSRFLPAQSSSELPEAETTIAELLHRNGYATAHFGKWHVGRTNPARHGFEENDGATNNGGPANVENPNPKEAFGMAERGTAFMARQVKAGKPFYLQLSQYAGRGGTDARPETYAAVRARARNDHEARLAGAAAVTEDMDTTIGMVLAKLDALGIADTSYVIYTADHGAMGRQGNAPLRSGKGTVWEGGLRVPLIMRGPTVKAGVCSHVRATTVDLFPTIAALAGVREALPKQLEGGNLAPVLADAPNAVVKRAREELVMHFPHYDRDGDGPSSAILLGELKLVSTYETGELHLFNLAHDPGEARDLVKTMPQETAALEQRLRDYLRAVQAQMPTANPRFESRRR